MNAAPGASGLARLPARPKVICLGDQGSADREHLGPFGGLYQYKATMAGPDTTLDRSSLRDAFFDRTVHHHARLLYRVAFSVLRNPADAEDAVAEALLKLLRSGAWEGVSNEKAFLTRTVWRSALDRLASRPPGNKVDPDEFALYDDQPSPERRTVTAEQSRLLNRWIDALPLDLREPLLLSAVEELNSREIGEAMHLPEGTVRTRLMRARALLREQYQAHQRSHRDREVAVQGPAL